MDQPAAGPPYAFFWRGNDMRKTGLLWSLISNSTSHFSPGSAPATAPDTGSLVSSGWLCTRLGCKMAQRANKRLPKFTPIFLILPQTLVVCQNWLASNLEKDILRKCQKCRRMEDNSDCCSLSGQARIISNSQALLGIREIFSRWPIKDIQFLMGSGHIWLKQWRIICNERWIVPGRDHEKFSNV